MTEKEKIIRYYKGTNEEEVALHLIGIVEAVNKNRKYRLSNFLDPLGQEIAEIIKNHYPDIKLDFSGGFIGAERQVAIFCHEDFLGEAIKNISCVKITWNDKFNRPTHRDILGAIMGLGIKREMIGDILISLGQSKILCLDTMADFLINNLTKVGSTQVSCEKDTLDSIMPKEEKIKEITSTVASLRLDSVAATGYGTSRSKMSTLIGQDKVKVNWQSAKSSSQNIKLGDMISIRGRGRLEVAEVRGTTKKGRYVIVLKRYI